MKPFVQVALDNTSLEDALRVLSKGVGDAVDIIEVGTLLLAAEGKRAVSVIRSLYPTKTIVADFKMADAAGIMVPMFLDNGADYMTVICAADPSTMRIADQEARKRGKLMQIELYGPWDVDRAKMWRELGLDHIIYHHSRDEGKEWGEKDIELIKELAELEFNVTVTGGLKPEHIKMFVGLPIFAFIGGRSIREAEEPVKEIDKFRDEINKYWE